MDKHNPPRGMTVQSRHIDMELRFSQKSVEQLKLAYSRQADRIWILNVGDIKALEVPINHFMDLAYNTTKWGYDSVPQWLELWATRDFDAQLAKNISSAFDRYGRLAGRRKYELVDKSVYSLINYSEADAVLAEWATLATDTQAIYDALAAEAQPAFYELLLQPVMSGWTVYKIHIGAARNELYVEQKRTSANKVAQDVLSSFLQDANLTKTYHNLLNGKVGLFLDLVSKFENSKYI